jgi:hypothetical protein
LIATRWPICSIHLRGRTRARQADLTLAEN